ncbi:MAG: hypothetical protein ACPG6P_06075 [Akkermansiaceae bacterium]
MNRSSSILAAITTAALCSTGLSQDQSDKDTLRFESSNTLYGSFLGFAPDGKIKWKHTEADDPIAFSTGKIHRITLNRGRGHKATTHTSSVKLINGDAIPGKILSANGKTVELLTDHLGQISIPADVVQQINPHPHGGKMFYYGPLDAKGWKLIDTGEKKSADKKENEEKKEAKKKDPTKPWRHYASAWYSGSNRYSLLTRQDALPDRCQLSFKMAWRGNPYCTVALHADLNPPEGEDEKNRFRGSRALGRAYLLTFSSSSASLRATTFNEEGELKSENIDNSYVSTHIRNKSEADVEIRLDKKTNTLMLYLNGSFKSKWDLGDDYLGKGNGLAFLATGSSNNRLRISDIVISPWNGRMDSATSRQSEQKDVILLTNGLDRFSGKLVSIKDGKVTFESNYSTTLKIPIEEVVEINLASKGRRDVKDDENRYTHFTIFPHGTLSGTPAPGEDGRTQLTSPLLGQLSLDTNYVDIIDFTQSNNLLDIWDDNF